ncbi:MAG: methylenetetrahydrofolate reductase [Proteobacteria bacterium]|nr:methylenetetrahydrofolate reductase [Pseudomonadota bacterium]
MKIIDKIQSNQLNKKPFFSFEFFPPKTEGGLQNLYARLDRMASLEPCFIDVTWGAGGSTSETTLTLSKNAQLFFGLDVMMHITCANMSEAKLRNALDQARDSGIQNIMALRGDVPNIDSQDSVESFLDNSVDMIKWIRKNYGDTFCIAVGGYPEGHPESKDKVECVKYLKKKIDAGADFIVTQLFFDIGEYRDFLNRCESVGIKCPVIPGILPIISFERFQKFTEFTQIKVPQHIRASLDPIKTDDEKVRAYGVSLCAQMSKELIEMGAPGLHYYTLNLESSVTEALQELNLLEDCRVRRAMPWRASTVETRKKEEVRPIFWSNRPKSYLARTMTWDDFPNGRWGSSFSPTYGDLNDYYVFRRNKDHSLVESRKKIWGHPQTVDEIANVFVNFCSGKINWLPWCEMPIQIETGRIINQLVNLNRNGFFSINSQPQVNAAPSDSPDVGWGGSGGYVFQKAYIEFFCSPEKLATLKSKIKNFPSMSYHAVNAKGVNSASFEDRTVSAVTWGVFPGKEVLQPTIVDSDSFMIWKDEAFDLWLSEWRSLYEKNSPSWNLLSEIHSSYFLVNVIEHDFVEGNIYKLFESL